MKKENLIQRAEKWEKQVEEMQKLGYPRGKQEEVTKMSTAIIKALCEQEGVTPLRAKAALKMAGEILNEEMERDAIL